MNAHESELMDEVAQLARRAEGVFLTRSDLRRWLTCVLHQRLHGVSRQPDGRCDAVSAAACAAGLDGKCPVASTPSELDQAMRQLSTARLEALLKLTSGTRTLGPERPDV